MERKIGQPHLRLEIVVVVLIGALGTVGNAYLGLEILDAVDRESLRFPVLGFALEPIIGAIVLWLVYSIGLHVISDKIFRTRGPIRRLLKSTAWALVPIGIGNLLKSGLWFLLFEGMDIQQVMEEGDTATETSGVDTVISEGMSDPLFLGAEVLVLISVLVSGYLMIHAVQNAKDLPRDDAVKAVGVLVVIHVLYLGRAAVDAATSLG